MSRGLMKWFFFSGVIVFSPVVSAQSLGEGLDTERFKPAMDSQGLVWTEGGQGERGGDLHLGFYLHYSHNPLVLKGADDEVIESLVSDRLAANFLISMGLTDWLTVAMDVPAIVHQAGSLVEADGSEGDLASAGLGDVRLSPKFTLLRQERFGVSLALLVPVTLPSGDEGAFIGSRSVTFMPTLALSRSLLGDALWLGFNLGSWIQGESSDYQDLQVDSELFYRAGARFQFDERWAALGEVTGGARVESIGENKPEETPLEWLLGGRFSGPFDLDFTMGMAFGSLPGWGTPNLRVLFGLAWSPKARDADNDGVMDDSDRCPREAGPPENDGCPWPDSDKDGLTDNQDQCPQESGPAENHGCPWGDLDRDGLNDQQDACPKEAGPRENKGCPWADADKDGVRDQQDKCPDVAGPAENDGCPYSDADKDGVRDADDSCPEIPGPPENKGCPWGDSDNDGLADNLDRCPREAEDKDGFEDDDGCPDPDNDKDGVPDAQDKCPDQPETINGIKDDDGCPDQGKVVVIVRKEKIEILQKIHFATGKDVIMSKSFNLLNQIAQTMQAHSEIQHVRIEGHTDSQGSEAYNQQLSQRRADSVKAYLIKRGVDPARMESVGFGESRPIMPNNTHKGREQNRRVEFVIVDQSR